MIPWLAYLRIEICKKLHLNDGLLFMESGHEKRDVVKSTLLPTKLHPPSLPAKWIQRSHLNQRLDEGLQSKRQITLLSAPAGFGKTICICDWLNTLDDWQESWLSLAPSDDDPGRFFAYFIAALQNVHPNLGREIEAVIRSGRLPPVEVITANLINDLMEMGDRFLLVLDDFQLIQDAFILQVLEQLIDNLPPQLYLVLLTREDPPLPLARLRANNLLTEIRARDLRFSVDDVGRFLDEVIGLALSGPDIAKLEEKTEGWIVGLQLAGLSLKEQDNQSDFLANLSGSHRFILSYLTEQVLSQQTTEIQHFLLQTAILDQLNGDLCNAVTGRLDSGIMLENLFRANLFLTPLDDEAKWYRYHHLFADLLRDLQNTRLKDETAALHQRASRWYAQAGMAREAIQHALCAVDYALAVDLLESHAMVMIMQGYVKTVNTWVQAIPPEWRIQSPRTHLAFAWMHLLGGAYTQISPYFEQLQAIFENSQTESQLGAEYSSLYAEWLVLQSLLRYMQGKRTECMDMAIQALQIAPEHDSRVRSLALYARASVCWSLEEYPQAVEYFQTSIQYGRAAGNFIAEMMSTIGLTGMLLEIGQLNLTFEIASQAVERIERAGVLPPISAVVYAGLGDAHYQWYQIEEAQRCFQRALHLSTLGGSNTIIIMSHVLLSRLFHIKGNLETAANEIQKAADLMPVEAPEYVRQEVTAQQVRLYLAQNRLAAAQMALQRSGFSFQNEFSFPALPESKSISYSVGLLFDCSLRILVTEAKNEAANLITGLKLADDLIARAFQSQQLLIMLEALLLRAQIHTKLENHSKSQTDYLHALELAEPEGFIGVFVEQNPVVAKALKNLIQKKQLGTDKMDYVERILAAFAQAQSWSLAHSKLPVLDLSAKASIVEQTTPAILAEPLSDRELDVLRLMADGLKYKEIAERLFISLNTVRSHTKSIYGKLNVRNRTRAIEKARQFQIL